MKRRGRWFRRSLRVIIASFGALNVIAAFHAWKFTHFAKDGVRYTRPQDIPLATKIKIMVTGVDMPRPQATRVPTRPYKEIVLQDDKRIVCWQMLSALKPSKGTVILFHGYGSEKSGMLDKAYLLLDQGYDVLLPDFRGSGASEGSTTTIGFDEAKDVKACYDFVKAAGEQSIILLGTSMGAVAVLKYLHDGGEQPKAAILECPFGTMYSTVAMRFKMMHLPTFPGAGLLLFWGGAENGFWAFSHNPDEYAKAVKCPVLLMFGERDDRVSRAEIDAVFANLHSPKTLHTFPEAGHNDYLMKYRHDWDSTVSNFIRSAL